MDTSRSSLYLQDHDEIKRVFDRFDTNSDGQLSSDELAEVLKNLGTAPSPEEIARMMEEIDTDKDGFISFDEFERFYSAGSDNGEGEMREAFEMYDINKNGLISSSELHQILTKIGEKCTEQDCVNMITSVDADGDGFVNFEEFKTMMSRAN
ncbi:hypothetical protein DCAR_0416158 [Daucus carota subsp. sativus]|uniref:EF-hand domain-containing protein n=1 Tax=Daucus carota subsp. sativus TaxID=79200 RepID=A0AAF0WXK7_DAUCS|nr:PREDICTED: calcium-binding allergen Ole e 8-like [Daucus carota subsp. sativus]WOG96821.1 hypothetical protein DCAR_0416158 [Daucus carota subsp. sativus]